MNHRTAHHRKPGNQLQRAALLLGFASLTAVVCAQAPVLSQTSDELLTLESAAARKAAVQTQLGELEQGNLSEEEIAAARNQLSQLVAGLTAFEKAIQRRDTYKAHLASLPQRLEEAAASRRRLQERSPPQFPDATELLRAEYDARRQALEAELRDLAVQAASEGVRLARLPEDIQTRKAALERLAPERQASGGAATQENRWVSDTELIDVQIQGHRADLEALEAERLWLIERGPLHDALLGVARLRLEHVRADLGLIQGSLGKAFQEQRETLHERVFRLQQALAASTYPAATIPLQVRLRTAGIQRDTADFQQQLARLRKEVRGRETLNHQIRQDTNRLVSLAQQYASGERVVQRLLIKFENLHRQRRRFTDNLVKVFTLSAGEAARDPLQVLGAKLRGLSETLFAVDDQLYEFDRLAGEQVNQLTGALLSASPNERVAALSGLRTDLELQRAALREQQQVLVDLTQTGSRLVVLHHDHRRLLDVGYRLVLSKMFWLKNSDSLNWALAGEMTTQAMSVFLRVVSAMRSDLSHLWLRLRQNLGPWGLLALLVGVLPLIVKGLGPRLGKSIQASLATSMEQDKAPHIAVLLLLALKAATWPAYLALLGWSHQLFIVQHGDDAGMTTALISGVYLAAVVLGIGLFAQNLFRSGGWAQQIWDLDDNACRFLRRTFRIGWIAGLLFLVPRQVVLTASPDPFLAGGSQTLERLLFLALPGRCFHAGAAGRLAQRPADGSDPGAQW